MSHTVTEVHTVEFMSTLKTTDSITVKIICVDKMLYVNCTFYLQIRTLKLFVVRLLLS